MKPIKVGKSSRSMFLYTCIMGNKIYVIAHGLDVIENQKMNKR